MTIRALVVTILLLFTLLAWCLMPAQAAVLWFNGLESAGSGFTGPNCVSVPAADASVAYTGGYGMVAVTARCIGQQTPSHPTTVYVRTRFRLHGIAGGPPGSNTPVICLGEQSLGASCLAVEIDTSRKMIFGAATGTTSITDNTWFLLEAKGVVDASVGGVEVKINGNTEFSSFSTNTSALVSFGYVSFGPFGLTGIVSIDYDDLMICDSSYCPQGGTIARQGAAGTPTYDAWTKNSCVGGTIEGCWSNTPFTTGSNASSATASAAQTMLVHDFKTTQTGHGTEIIQTHDTINACMTVSIMKSGTASAPISIRRRLNGVDTDTAKTLTTSDAHYDDGIWTTTTDILRDSSQMEIGEVHGAGVATDTVEDMWLMCDYAVGSPIRHRTIYR